MANAAFFYLHAAGGRTIITVTHDAPSAVKEVFKANSVHPPDEAKDRQRKQ